MNIKLTPEDLYENFFVRDITPNDLKYLTNYCNEFIASYVYSKNDDSHKNKIATDFNSNLKYKSITLENYPLLNEFIRESVKSQKHILFKHDNGVSVNYKFINSTLFFTMDSHDRINDDMVGRLMNSLFLKDESLSMFLIDKLLQHKTADDEFGILILIEYINLKNKDWIEFQRRFTPEPKNII